MLRKGLYNVLNSPEGTFDDDPKKNLSHKFIRHFFPT